MSVDILNTITGDLIASNIVATTSDLATTNVVAATDHDDDLCARGDDWFDLFGYPVRTFAVEAAVVLALELFAGEFEEDALIHTISVSAIVTNMKQGNAFNRVNLVVQSYL